MIVVASHFLVHPLSRFAILEHIYSVYTTNLIVFYALFLKFTMVGPTASLTPLSRADGSASYQCPSTGSNILGSVNAPIELPGRRDALKPEDATVEVFVKPGTAPGGVGERYVEGIIKNMLGKLILGREKGYARRGVVITLAIVGGESVARGDSVGVSCRNNDRLT